jgi:outer membrane protein
LYSGWFKNQPDYPNASISSRITDISTSNRYGVIFRDVCWWKCRFEFGRSIDPNTNGIVETSFISNSFYLSASLDLFKGFSQLNELAYQKYLSISAKSNLRKVEDEVAFAIMNAFFDVAYFEELISIASEQKELSKLNLKKAEVLVTAGLKAEADLLEVKANVEKDELFYVQSQNQYNVALLNLRRAMNVGSDFSINVEMPQDSIFAIPVTDANSDSLFHIYSMHSQQLVSLENEWKASLKKINVKRAGYYPSLKLEASFGTAYYETNKDNLGKTYGYEYQLKNNRSQYVGLSLLVPSSGKTKPFKR